jgi:hypothetical protein
VDENRPQSDRAEICVEQWHVCELLEATGDNQLHEQSLLKCL